MGGSPEKNGLFIPSLGKCPVTGLPIRHDQRWRVFGEGGEPYRAEFSRIGENIVHAHIDGFTTLDTSQRYLKTLDSLCDEIGAPVYLLEDYSLHKGTSGEAKNYYLKHQQRNTRLAAVVFFGASPFFGAVIRVGRLFARVPFAVEIEPDYAAAVRLAVSLREQGAARRAPAGSDGDRSAETHAGETFELKLSGGSLSATYELLPGGVVFGKVAGTIRTAAEMADFMGQYRSVLKSLIGSGRTYIRLVDWTGLRYVSWTARSSYVRHMNELQDEFPCALTVVFGMSPFVHAAYSMSVRIMYAMPTMVATDFNHGLAKIQAFEASRRGAGRRSRDTAEMSLTRHEFDAQLRALLEVLGAINWEQNGLPEGIPAEADTDGPFRPLYDAFVVLKHDYDEMAQQKLASEKQQRDLEEKLRHSEKMQAIGQLAGGIAHDYNNQLAVIMGFTELLRLKLSDRPDLVAYTDTVLETSRRSADLTAQLLAFARKGKYLSVRVDVHQLIGEVVSILDHSIDKRIVIERALGTEPFVVVGDPSQLQNALLNLGVNARDAMPEGGTLRFSTELVVVSEVQGKETGFDLAPGPYVCVRVVDTGHGMSAEAMQHLFEPFFTTKERGRGTGMGLPAVYGTVKNHNGAIKVRSSPGRGTTVEILLPCAMPGSGSAATDGRLDTGSVPTATASFRILVVDDEPGVLATMVEVLTRLGHAVTAKHNGKEAVDHYTRSWSEIDLVILDLIMPVMSGTEAFARLRAIHPEARVLISSGYGLDGDAEKLIAAGARGFLQKPFNHSDLENGITTALADR